MALDACPGTWGRSHAFREIDDMFCSVDLGVGGRLMEQHSVWQVEALLLFVSSLLLNSSVFTMTFSYHLLCGIRKRLNAFLYRFGFPHRRYHCQ
jgi:hypothetical protein